MAESTVTLDLNGKWLLDRNENFNEYMKAVGIGMVKRKLINSLSTVIEITQDGDDFKFSTKTSLGSRLTCFKLGVVYPETNPMWGDKEQRVLANVDAEGKLVQKVMSAPEDMPMSFEREIIDGELVLTMIRGYMVAKRYFVKQP